MFINMMLEAVKSQPNPHAVMQQLQSKDLNLNDFLVQLAKLGHLDPSMSNALLKTGNIDSKTRSMLTASDYVPIAPRQPPMPSTSAYARMPAYNVAQPSPVRKPPPPNVTVQPLPAKASPAQMG